MIKYKRWVGYASLIPLIILIVSAGISFAQSNANYKLIKSVTDQGGGRSQSTNYKLLDAVGLSTPIGASNSTNYKIFSGLFFGGGTIENPVLTVTPTTLDFGTSQTSLTFKIKNSGSGTLQWTVQESPDKPWITSINPNQGSNNATVTVTVDHSKLIGADDTGTLVVNSNGGTENVTVKIGKSENLLVNGDFSGGLDPWFLYVDASASATASVQNGECTVDISNGGTEGWHVQLLQSNPHLLIENGITYELSFEGWAASERQISMAVIHDGEPWTPYHDYKTYTLTQNRQTFRYQFVMNHPTDAEAMFTIHLGTSTVNVSFDNVVLRKVSTSPVLSVNPTMLDFGTSKNSLTFEIKNSGSGTLQWTVQENPDKPWIASITPNQGSDNAIVTVTVDRSQFSGASDTGTLLVSSNGGNQNVTVKIGEEGGVPIAPRGPVSQPPGSEFWVDIDVGSSSNPVTDLFGVSFELNYTNTAFIDYVTSEAGAFIGNDVIFFPTPDDANGKVSFGISRKSGQGGVNGHGAVARIKLAVAPGTPNDTQIQFTITNVSANDPNGNPIQLSPGTLTVTIGAGTIIVWPGDTNNNGIVNQADILPIGLHLGKTGTPRSNASMNWIGQPATPWTLENATYADANGDGIVNQADVLAIGLNWNKTHTNFLAGNMSLKAPKVCQSDTSIIMLKFNGTTNPGDSFSVDVFVKNVTDLFGLSYELFYKPNVFIDILSVEVDSGNILGTENDLIFFPMVEENAGLDTGKVSVGLSRKFGQGGVTADSGMVTRIKAHMSEDAVIDVSKTLYWFKNIAANDASGNTIPFKVDTTTLNLKTDVETRVDKTVPTTHLLCQNRPNPFNPETTIEYHLPYSVDVTITIYNLQGQEIRKLDSGIKQAGVYSVQWNGKDNSGRSVPSGIYFYQLKANSQIPGKRSLIDTKRMILMK